jgi:hypothetical protein
MGVRFQCPQGHQLHVKAELAGRRGICPECGAKFIVPSFSGGRVAEDAGTASSPPSKGGIPAGSPPPQCEEAIQTPSVFIPTAPAAAPATPAPIPSPDPNEPPAIATAPDAVAWYVRPAAGGQFGPASTDVFRGWVEDGRVAADSWVWRTGWTDWRPGGEAMGSLADVIAPPPAVAAPPVPEMAAVPIVDAPSASPAADEASASPHHAATTAEARRAEMRRRRRRNNAIALALGVVALVVAVVMAVVLNR